MKKVTSKFVILKRFSELLNMILNLNLKIGVSKKIYHRSRLNIRFLKKYHLNWNAVIKRIFESI